MAHSSSWSVVPPSWKDASRCPGCGWLVPQEYQFIPKVTCEDCQRFQLTSGLVLATGSDARPSRVHSPLWNAVQPTAQNAVRAVLLLLVLVGVMGCGGGSGAGGALSADEKLAKQWVIEHAVDRQSVQFERWGPHHDCYDPDIPFTKDVKWVRVVYHAKNAAGQRERHDTIVVINKGVARNDKANPYGDSYQKAIPELAAAPWRRQYRGD